MGPDATVPAADTFVHPDTATHTACQSPDPVTGMETVVVASAAVAILNQTDTLCSVLLDKLPLYQDLPSIFAGGTPVDG